MFTTILTVWSTFLILGIDGGLLDPGPPYHEAVPQNSLSHPQSQVQTKSNRPRYNPIQYWRNHFNRLRSQQGNGPLGQERPPLVSHNVLQSVIKAMGAEISYGSNNPSGHNSSPLVQPQYNFKYQSSQSAPQVQSAHVYLPQTNTGSVHRPMPNVIVRHEGSHGSPNNYQYSQPQPYWHQPAAQYSEQQPIVAQPSISWGVQNSPQVQQPLVNIVQLKNSAEKVQDVSPAHVAYSFSFPPKWKGSKDKKQPHKHSQDIKGKPRRPRRPHLEKPYPIFTTLGQGLDALNIVRRGVKKGAGKVIASGVNLGGKIAAIGATAAAKVIKVVSAV